METVTISLKRYENYRKLENAIKEKGILGKSTSFISGEIEYFCYGKSMSEFSREYIEQLQKEKKNLQDEISSLAKQNNELKNTIRDLKDALKIGLNQGKRLFWWRS